MMIRTLFLLLFTSGSVVAQVNLNQGLMAYYPFSGNANDVSGNNNNPVFNNATLTADRFGNPNSAYSFNGTSNYMKILNSATLNFNTQMSITTWVKVAGFYQGPCHGNSILVKEDAGGLAGNYLLFFDDNGFTNGQNCAIPVPDIQHQNFYGTNTPPPNGGYSPFIQTNQWYMVTYTSDGTTAKVYVNCDLKLSFPANGWTFTNAYDLYLGKMNNAAFPYWFNGTMDEVRIYNRALNQQEVNVLGGCAAPPCNNWLRTQAVGQSVTVGDLDISGNQMTIEANFNCSSFPVNRPDKWEDIVSKHSNTTDANYVLRMDLAAITTTTGHYLLSPLCDNLVLNKTYHVALVYDGINLKFYRNGFLMNQMPVTGNLILNNWMTTIGDYAVNNPVGTNFLGYINEVRMWNVARTQAQLRTFMNTSLPNPATQPGLMGYYIFDDLLNKQGNAVYNGTLNGGATINNTNPNCTFLADSCALVQNISGIINTYTPVLSLNPCDNKITVEDGTTFNTGDTVLMIQMKGAVIDSTNTATFGTITDYKNAGNYEFNYVKSKAGNIIELKNTITRQYDLPGGKVQLIRVPYFQNATISSTLTCLPWDGSKGGVLVLNAQDSVILNANIDVSGKGFRGGADPFSNPPVFNCYENQFYYPVNPDLASGKGEGIAEVSASKSFGKGALANGGGSGNSHNSGGGGGANAATGGFGGYHFEAAPCNGTVPFDNRGFGGKALTYSNPINKIFLGGGGGAGHSNNPEAFQATGGNGAGMVIIMAGKLKSNGFQTFANGSAGTTCGNTSSGCHEGMGGGGAGGTVLLKINNYLDVSLFQIQGGAGANMTAAGFFRVGPGGGGGGGKVWLTDPSLPVGASVNVTAGQNGVCTGYANDPWGATPGQLGSLSFSLAIPFDNTLFKPNIDSVRIKDSIMSCSSFDFKGFGYTNTNPVANWQWYFGDGGTAATQNTNHNYAAVGTFTVKLVVTDINGCKDSITRNVSTTFLLMDAGPADTICNASSTTLQSSATGATQYSWTPAIYLNNPTILNPVATPPVTTTFYLTATNAAGCSQTDSVRIEVRSANGFSISPPVNICKNLSVQLNASGGDIYSWSPAGSLNNAAIPNPLASPANTTPYTVNITDTVCGFSTSLSTTVTIIPLPNVRALKSNDIDCSTPQSLLSASGAALYSWLPSGTLNNPNSASPIATPTATTQYNVTGTDISGCINYDSIIVKVNKNNDGGYLMPTAFTPNNDGLNDCFGIKYWGTILELNFSIYNRWGERIFYTTNPGACWDGKIGGVPQDPNVFVYMIRAKTTCKPEVFRKGTFVLIR